MPCRALEAFRLTLTADCTAPQYFGLNALSGIGGVQTLVPAGPDENELLYVLMPCRALEAFRPLLGQHLGIVRSLRLNALSGIGGVQTCQTLWEFHPLQILSARLCVPILHPFPDSVNPGMERTFHFKVSCEHPPPEARNSGPPEGGVRNGAGEPGPRRVYAM